MELLRFLVLVPMVLSPLVNSQDHSMSSKTFVASPSSVAPYSPLDEERSSYTEEEGEEGVRLKTIPSGDEGLQLAIGDSAMLECQLSIPSATHRFKSLSWTNTLTHVTMTTDNITENRYGPALCIVKAIRFHRLHLMLLKHLSFPLKSLYCMQKNVILL